MGKKKSTKKSSSKSKKSSNASAGTRSVSMEGEADTPPQIVADEESEEDGNVDLNEDASEEIAKDAVVESDGNDQSEHNDTSTVEPKDDAATEKVIPSADEEKPNDEASNAADNTIAVVEEDKSPDIANEDINDTKDDMITSKNENDKVNIVEQSESNGHVSDDDDAIFLDARSFETEGSDDEAPPEETNGDEQIANNPETPAEPDADERVEEIIQNETSNADIDENTQQEIQDGSNENETSLPLESDDPISLDIQPEPVVETKVEVVEIIDPGPDAEEPVQLIDDSYAKDNTYDRGESDSYDGTHTTYVDELPLFHYSRMTSSGLPRGIPKNQAGHTNMVPLITPSKSSELAVVRVDREELVSSASNVPAASTNASDIHDVSRTASANSDGLSAAAMRKRQREQALLLSSDLWFQPHSIVANGYEGGKITLTRVSEGQSSGSSNASPSVVFASLSAEIGGIVDTSGHGNSNSNKSYSTVLQLREGANTASAGGSIVDISFDASGSVLGAIDEGGHCSIWEFKYITSIQSTSLLFGDFLSSSNENTQNDTSNFNNFFTPSSTPNPTRPQVSSVSAPAPATGMFSSFISVLTGVPPEDENLGSNSSSAAAVDNSTNGSNNPIDAINSSPGRSVDNNVSDSGQPSQTVALIPALTAEILQQTRSNYPAKWGPPTCLAVDPAYSIKRDKSIVVGFANGQVYLTKKGTFFQRRNDTMLYQAGNTRGDSYRGIESVVWRGPLVAFADATGIKLIDSENLTRIAHINRPAGASPSLYPSIRDLSPSLVFETSQHLLVGWGDCLMQLYVEEHEEEPSLAQGGGSSDTGIRDIKIRRSASCTMAWELDCVACDIVPLDSDHVVVLGLVSLEEDGEDGNQMRGPSHDLEMQILSRRDGTISYSDSLPLIDGKRASIESTLSARDFRLLSSFALPRMSNDDETKALRALEGANDLGFVGIDVSFDINQPLFAGTDSFANNGIKFRDPHLEWNIKSIIYDEEIDQETTVLEASNDDDSSVDSDDYECILRPIETIRPLPTQSPTPTDQSVLPPIMVVCTQSDAILSLTSTVDDAIEYSLENHRCALALSRGLRHKRQLRRYSLDDLINFYLEAVLRIPRRDGPSDDAAIAHPNGSSLSLRRMQLAIKAMPVLLGDRISLWQRWTKELERIPGSLFLLRKYLPVRDPILPSSIYVRILEKMLVEVEELSNKKDDPSSIKLHAQASEHFLESLIAWGPTKVLKEYISFYKYNKQRRKAGKDLDDNIRSTEISLQRRYLQTAAGYLIFPVRDIEEELQVSAPRYEVHNVDTEDSLFDVSKALAAVAPRVPIVAPLEDFGEDKNNEAQASASNSHTSLEAMARLRMMQGEFDLALKCLLAIGACHATESIESFEKSAVRLVNGSDPSTKNISALIGNHSYEFVMNLIERHELNQFLFEKDFILSTDSKLFMPIFALIRLVGLQRVGNFLMEHCVAAGFSYNTTLREMNAFNFSEEDSIDEQNGMLRRGSLPIDKVAEQLENSPSILHWYLHLVFTRRPDFYIHFPTNSIPSKVITNLHRRHFQLYVDFAGDTRDSSKVLEGVEAYKVESKTTPLLSFLKAALPLGGVIPVDARRVLEIERRKDSESEEDDESKSNNEDSPTFALELAYIIEKYSDETETEAMGILNLYLKGAKSLPLAVSYAQRQKKFSARLWDKLISYCLEEASDGTIYGELLEAAALKGADLSRLVERIPPGMVVEGLRPKLVAAVADYRMKLEIYEAAIAAGSEEKVTLMREIGHRARRGLRYDTEKNCKKSFAEVIAEKIRSDERKGGANAAASSETETAAPQKLVKTRMRRDHKRLVYSIPRR